MYFDWPKSWIWQTLEKVINIFCNRHFHNASKEFHARVQKCHFGNFSFLPKWHFWTRAWNSKIFLAKSIFLKHYEKANKKLFSYHVPESAKSRIYTGKSTKRGFFQKGLTRFQKFFSISFPVNTWQDWRAKLESAYSLMVHYCKNTVCVH